MITPEQEHNERAAEPMYWLNKASDLHAAAGALWYCMDQKDAAIPEALGLGSGFDMTVSTWPVYRMLCGMSLELAYKAIILAKGKKIVTTHDLLKLAELAEISLLKRADIEMLQFLTECIIWDGKYPVPKAWEAGERFVHLTYDRFFKPKKIGETAYILKPISPHPLDWPEFQPFWKQAVAGFDFFYQPGSGIK